MERLKEELGETEREGFSKANVGVKVNVTLVVSLAASVRSF